MINFSLDFYCDMPGVSVDIFAESCVIYEPVRKANMMIEEDRHLDSNMKRN